MTHDAAFWIVQFLHGLQLSMLLFLLSVGLTVIFGLLHFVNLAHGALYALGAFAGYTAIRMTGSFWGGFVLAPIAVAALGAVLYFALIRRMRHAGHMNQVLVTFGLIFVFLDAFRYFWGDIALGVEVPPALSGLVEIFGITYSAYRLFIIALGLLVMTVLHLILSRTQIGAIIRAGVDNGEMAGCLGINVELVFFWVFCAGCALAGLAGVVAAPVVSISPSMGTEILIPCLIVVVIGGLGSLKGAVAGSLLTGFIQTFGAVMAPAAASISVYALLAAVLILKPAGLFPARS
jgi:branched-chain amino acid transport system permease protein